MIHKIILSVCAVSLLILIILFKNIYNLDLQLKQNYQTIEMLSQRIIPSYSLDKSYINYNAHQSISSKLELRNAITFIEDNIYEFSDKNNIDISSLNLKHNTNSQSYNEITIDFRGQGEEINIYRMFNAVTIHLAPINFEKITLSSNEYENNILKFELQLKTAYLRSE